MLQKYEEYIIYSLLYKLSFPHVFHIPLRLFEIQIYTTFSTVSVNVLLDIFSPFVNNPCPTSAVLKNVIFLTITQHTFHGLTKNCAIHICMLPKLSTTCEYITISMITIPLLIHNSVHK